MNFKIGKVMNLKKVLKQVEDFINEDIRKSSSLLEDIGDFAVKRIQAETRLGKNLNRSQNTTSARKQPDLSEATKNFRERLAAGKVKITHPWWFKPDRSFFKPTKSNLTATGQMLDSLEGKVTRSKGEVVVVPTGTRDSGLQNDNTIKTNVGVAKELASQGRTFLGLDKLGMQRIRKLILDEVRRMKRKRGF